MSDEDDINHTIDPKGNGVVRVLVLKTDLESILAVIARLVLVVVVVPPRLGAKLAHQFEAGTWEDGDVVDQFLVQLRHHILKHWV